MRNEGAQVCACTYTHTHVHACMRACVHACMRACVHACMRACVHACMRACESAEEGLSRGRGGGPGYVGREVGVTVEMLRGRHQPRRHVLECAHCAARVR